MLMIRIMFSVIGKAPRVLSHVPDIMMTMMTMVMLVMMMMTMTMMTMTMMTKMMIGKAPGVLSHVPEIPEIVFEALGVVANSK